MANFPVVRCVPGKAGIWRPDRLPHSPALLPALITRATRDGWKATGVGHGLGGVVVANRILVAISMASNPCSKTAARSGQPVAVCSGELARIAGGMGYETRSSHRPRQAQGAGGRAGA